MTPVCASKWLAPERNLALSARADRPLGRKSKGTLPLWRIGLGSTGHPQAERIPDVA